MKSALTIFLLCFALLLQACASRISVIDTANVNKEHLEEDMDECKQYASAYDGSEQIAESVLLGAFFSGLQAWMFSDGDSSYAKVSAIFGGIEGGVIAAVDVSHEQTYIEKSCLRDRGYIVLN